MPSAAKISRHRQTSSMAQDMRAMTLAEMPHLSIIWSSTMRTSIGHKIRVHEYTSWRELLAGRCPPRMPPRVSMCVSWRWTSRQLPPRACRTSCYVTYILV